MGAQKLFASPIISKENFWVGISEAQSARMVSFVCEACQDTIKKPKLETVYISRDLTLMIAFCSLSCPVYVH